MTQAANCGNTLTKPGVTAKVYDYDTGATATSVYTSANAFTNSKNYCPITTCSVWQSNCVTALVAPFNTLLTVGASTPWALTISQTQAAGYPDVTVCYKCETATQSETE